MIGLCHYIPLFYTVKQCNQMSGDQHCILALWGGFPITQPFPNLYRHAIHQVKSENPSYRMVSFKIMLFKDENMNIVI